MNEWLAVVEMETLKLNFVSRRGCTAFFDENYALIRDFINYYFPSVMAKVVIWFIFDARRNTQRIPSEKKKNDISKMHINPFNDFKSDEKLLKRMLVIVTIP